MAAAENLTAARDGFAVTVERFSQLLESVLDTSVAIPDSEWTVRDAAAHVAGGTQRMAALARGEASTVPTVEKEFLDARARKLIAEIPETDGKKLADRIREALARLMGETAIRSGDQPVIFHGGI
ncbi:MAG TPA: maleylpyruvate isomerase N-terminal domain-containing protein, partial [Acidimicrobiia bacterium]|nr:maleylpyruvate isomerase N-terminal domain-containing protein [Acidimicrobiia bacterium]